LRTLSPPAICFPPAISPESPPPAPSVQVEFFPTSLKEFKWRNGWFYRYTRLSGATVNRNGLKIEMPDPTPLHTELLQIAEEQGLVDLKEYQDTEVRW
jgi:hypothetical protein